MKTNPFKEKVRSYTGTGSLVCFMVIFTFAAFLPGSAQVRNAELLRRVIVPTNQPVNIEVVRENQIQEVQRPLSTFRLPPGSNLAKVNSVRVKDFESTGHIIDQAGARPLRGLVLEDVIISNIVGEPNPTALLVVVDTIPPLLYDANLSNYSGILSITLLEDGEGVLLPKPLVQPVLIEVSPGGRATVEPQVVMIDHTNLPSTQFRITDLSPIAPLPVNIKTPFKPGGHLTAMKKESVLMIETLPQRVQGFGVDLIDIFITVRGNTVQEPVSVTVITNKGSLENNITDVTKEKPGSVKLRSRATGNATVTASANGVNPVSRDFQFVFPVMFICFSFLGGFIGALYRFFTGDEKKKFHEVIIVGVITGFMAALLYYVLAIEVFSFKFTRTINEFAVLGVGFLGALLLDRWIKSLISTGPDK